MVKPRVPILNVWEPKFTKGHTPDPLVVASVKYTRLFTVSNVGETPPVLLYAGNDPVAAR